MLTVISPAKRLDFDSELPALEATTPTLLEDTQALLDVTGQLTATNLSDLMNISDALGLLNYSRFQALLEPGSALKRQAVLAFKGVDPSLLGSELPECLLQAAHLFFWEVVPWQLGALIVAPFSGCMHPLACFRLTGEWEIPPV